MGQSLIHFVSTFVCAARGFIQKMINFRQRQQQARVDDIDPKKFPQKDWRAQGKWGKHTRNGPPKERLDSLLSTMLVFRAGVTGGEADSHVLWPETVGIGQWGKATDPSDGDGKWKCANVNPLEVWLSQGIGEGVPILVPLHENPIKDKALLDQMVDTGSRTVMGVAAVNGLIFRKLDIADGDIKNSLSGFEEVCVILKPVMDMVRTQELPPHNEKEGGKLAEKLSVFKVRVDPESTSGAAQRMLPKRLRRRLSLMMRRTSMSLKKMSKWRQRKRRKKPRMTHLSPRAGLPFHLWTSQAPLCPQACRASQRRQACQASQR